MELLSQLAVSGYIYSTRIGHSVSLELFNIRD
jgi:hypothetical protein